MKKQAILFGSIGTIVETSELQRQAFNQAFQEADLAWDWQPDVYRKLIARSGGRQRIEDFARNAGQDVDATAIHNRKTEIFDTAMVERGLSPRAGVADVLRQAKDDGVALAFVTTTSRANVDAIFEALGDQVRAADFSFVGDASMVASGKPDPEIYELCLAQLGLQAAACVAIEDTPVSAQAPRAAGIETVAFPGAYADREGFGDNLAVMDALSYQSLMGSD